MKVQEAMKERVRRFSLAGHFEEGSTTCGESGGKCSERGKRQKWREETLKVYAREEAAG